MSSFSLGDLAQTFMLQRRGAALKTEMARLNEEVATGQVSDIKSVLAGNVAYLSDLENDLTSLAGYNIATSEATQLSEAMQTALERMQSSASSLGTTLLTRSTSAIGPVLDQFSTEALSELETIVSALNTKSAGRSVFAGSATDQQALAGVDAILSGVRAATAGATNPQDIIDAASAWFDDPAGFTADIYTGSDDGLAPFRLGKGEAVSLQLTASDEVFLDTLKHVSIAVIANDDTFGLSIESRRQLLTNTGGSLFNAQGTLTAASAKVGSAQARIDALATRNSTEENALLIAKGALVQADPFEAATELEAVQFQLQSLYAITARMSDMSFVNFIR
ncbi:flagellin [Tateyamaria sp.]|uniref:flagellin n=1 Tax=Tateyamaria sp. TaxID=1929288 RepID=UPI00329C8761